VDIEEDSPDLAALDIAVELFGGRPDSRLAKRVREKDGLSYGFDSSLNTSIRDRNGVFVISGSYAPQNRAKVEAAAREELERALKDGFSAAEVETAKATVLTNRRQSLTQEHNVNALLISNLYWERSMQLREQRDRQYAGLTVEEVNAALRKYLKPEKLSVVVAGDFARK
jgi:zinc protease